MGYLTVSQVAEKLQVHENTVLRWLREGVLKGRRYGRLWRIPTSELDKVKEGKDDLATTER